MPEPPVLADMLNRVATLSWSPSPNTGLPITYTLYVSTADPHGVSTSQYSEVASGLTETTYQFSMAGDVVYFFTVRAVNDVGTGPSSDPSDAIYNATLIPPPSALEIVDAVELLDGTFETEITWTGITGYKAVSYKVFHFLTLPYF